MPKSIPPNTIKVIREFERIQKKICRHKMSIMFNEICINEEMLPIYIYIYIYIYSSKDRLLRIITILQCGLTQRRLQAGIETRQTFTIIPLSQQAIYVSTGNYKAL